MTCRDRLKTYFAEQGVVYEEQRHQLAFTAQETAASEHIPAKTVAKSVVAWTDGEPALLVLPAASRVDLARVRQALPAKEVRLATEPELSEFFPDCEVGAIPPFGNLYDVSVYVDKTLTEDETIVFPAGTHTMTLRVKYSDFARLVHPVIVEIAQQRAVSAS